MKTSYLTISNVGEGSYKEKGSRFLAFAHPVTNIEACSSRIESIRAKFHDARHHCYAYILEPDGARTRVNDDGEPSHSAGDPILGQIKSFGLSNTLVVVVRYFGGTKLGVPGLINAYKTASYEALSRCRTITRHITMLLDITYSYSDTKLIMKLVSDYGLGISNQKFEEKCFIQLEVKISVHDPVQSVLTTLVKTGNKLQFSWH